MGELKVSGVKRKLPAEPTKPAKITKHESEPEFITLLRGDDPYKELQKLTESGLAYNADPASSADVIKLYLTHEPEADSILKLFDPDTGKRTPQETHIIFKAITTLLLRVAGSLPDSESSLQNAVSTLLSTHTNYIYTQLNVTNKPDYVKTTIKMLTGMVVLNSRCAVEVLTKLSGSEANLEGLFNKRDVTDTCDIRTSLTQLTTAVMFTDDTNVLRLLLQQKELLTGVLYGVTYDDATPLQMFLSTFHNKLILNDQISKTLKIKALDKKSLITLIQLYNWQGPAAYSKKERKKKAEGKEISVDEDKKAAVIEVIQPLMLTLCSSYKHGVVFRDVTYGTSENNSNYSVFTAVTSLKSPWECPKQSELIVTYLRECPDQMKIYLNTLQTHAQVRKSDTWFAFVKFITQIISSQRAQNVVLVRGLPCKTVCSMMSPLLMPTLVTSQLGLLSSVESGERAVWSAGLQLLHTILHKLLQTIQHIQHTQHRHYTREEAHDIVLLLKQHAVKVLPSAVSVLSLWQTSLNKVMSDELKMSDGFMSSMQDPTSVLSDLQQIAQVLYYYNELMPQQLGDVQAHIGSMLEGLAWFKRLLKSHDKEVNAVMLAVLKLAAASHQAIPLMMEQNLQKNLCYLVLCAVCDNVSAAGEVLLLLLRRAGLLSCEQAGKPWIQHLTTAHSKHKCAKFLTQAVQNSLGQAKPKPVTPMYQEDNIDTLITGLGSLLCDDDTDDDASISETAAVGDDVLILSALGVMGSNPDADISVYMSSVLESLLYVVSNIHTIIHNTESLHNTLLDYINALSGQHITGITKPKKKCTFSEFLKYVFMSRDAEYGSSKLGDSVRVEAWLSGVGEDDIQLLLKQVLLYIDSIITHSTSNKDSLQLLHFFHNVISTIKTSGTFTSNKAECMKTILGGGPGKYCCWSENELLQVYSKFITEQLLEMKSADDVQQLLAPYLQVIVDSVSHYRQGFDSSILQLIDETLLSPHHITPLLTAVFSFNLTLLTTNKFIQKLLVAVLKVAVAVQDETLVGHQLHDVIPFYMRMLMSQNKKVKSVDEAMADFIMNFPGCVLNVSVDMLSICYKYESRVLSCVVYGGAKFEDWFMSVTVNSGSVTLLHALATYVSRGSVSVCVGNKVRAELTPTLEQWLLEDVSSEDTARNEYMSILFNYFITSAQDLKGLSSKVSEEIKASIVTSSHHIQSIVHLYSQLDDTTQCLTTLLTLLKNTINCDDEAPLTTILSSIITLTAPLTPQDTHVEVKLWNKVCKCSVDTCFLDGISDKVSLFRALLQVHKLVNSPNKLGKLLLSHGELFTLVQQSDDGSLWREVCLELWLQVCRADPSLCKADHVGYFISGYTATLHRSDQFILQTLYVYEQHCAVLSSHQPLLWGPTAYTTYSIPSTSGNLSKWKIPKPEDMYNIINSNRMYNTLHQFNNTVNMTPTVTLPPADIYDLRWFLPLWSSLLSDDYYYEFPCMQFIDTGCLSAVLVCLSSECEDVRSIAFSLLYRFYKQVQKAVKMRQGMIWIGLLDTIRAGAPDLSTKLPSLVALFLAQAVLVMRDPSHQLYSIICSVMLRKPEMDWDRLPEFFALWNSQTLQFKETRRWLLQVLRHGVKSQEDYLIAQRYYANKLIFTYWGSELADEDSKIMIVEVVSAWMSEPTICVSLYKNHGILSWLLGCYNAAGSNRLKSLLLHSITISCTSLLTSIKHQKQTAFSSVLCDEMMLAMMQLLQGYSNMKTDDVAKLLQGLTEAAATLKVENNRKQHVLVVLPDISQIKLPAQKSAVVRYTHLLEDKKKTEGSAIHTIHHYLLQIQKYKDVIKKIHSTS